MLINTKRALSLLIMILGLGVMVRSVAVMGTVKPSAGLVAGFAFAVYGAARLYMLGRAS